LLPAALSSLEAPLFVLCTGFGAIVALSVEKFVTNPPPGTVSNGKAAALIYAGAGVE